LNEIPLPFHRDFLNNLVSRESATHIYGVVLNETAFDTEQTLALRELHKGGANPWPEAGLRLPTARSRS